VCRCALADTCPCAATTAPLPCAAATGVQFHRRYVRIAKARKTRLDAVILPVLSSSRFLPNSSPSTHHNTAALRHPEQRCLVPTSFLFIQIAARPMNAPAAPSCYRARGMQDNAADVLPQRVERSYAIAIALATCRPGSEVGVGVGSDMC
jgi:hypothetical protein